MAVWAHESTIKFTAQVNISSAHMQFTVDTVNVILPTVQAFDVREWFETLHNTV